MAAIKLFKKGEENGIEKFQSQLYVGKDIVDFVREDNIMKVYDYRPKTGFDFYPYTEPYEIVDSINDMKTQKL